MTLATRIAVMHEGRLQQVGCPDDIYGRPANRFVAEFVGSPPINIVELDQHQTSHLSQIASQYLPLLEARASSASSVGIRPEGIRIGVGLETASTGISGRATITAILPTGGSWIVELDVSGQVLFATMNTAPSLEAGREVDFHAIPSAIHIFDGQGDRIDT